MDYLFYKDLVNSRGGSKKFKIGEDNYFVCFNSFTKTWKAFTVNDGYIAPERIYMSEEVAKEVAKVLNELNSKI